MSKTILIVVLVVVALGAGAGIAFFLRPAGGGEAHAAEAAPPEKTERLVIEERTLNLSDPETSHYLKVSPVLVMSGPGDFKEKGEELKPVIMDALIDVVSRSTYVSLLTADGKRALKEQLLTAFNERIEESKWKVKEILFTDFVME